MNEPQSDFSARVEALRASIRTSRHLAEDAEAFCDELQKGATGERIKELEVETNASDKKIRELTGQLEALEGLPDALAEVLQEMVRREPDATLREKLEDLASLLIDFENPNQLLIKLNLSPLPRPA